MDSNINDYKHVSFINVLPDLEDFEYQRIISNNRHITDDNEVLHHPLKLQQVLSNLSINSVSMKEDEISKQLSSYINRPILHNKIIEEQEYLANENTRLNSYQYQNAKPHANKFSNLREIEDVKLVSNDLFEADDGNPRKKNTSKIGNLSNGKSIAEMTLEELTLVENELRKNRTLKKEVNSDDFDFAMNNDSTRGVHSNSMSNYLAQHDSKSSTSILHQKEKLSLQNGYPTRPWVDNNSCILNYQTKMKKSDAKRTVFVYVSGREHTWTSLEYYFRYLQRDYDHLVIGTWIEKTHVIEPEFQKSQYTNSVHLNKPLKYFKAIENEILQSCHDFLNYAIYKNKLYKPMCITCHLQTGDNSPEIMLDFVHEYQPTLNIITSVTFNHFIKFQNETIKMANFLSKISPSCLIINQDYLAIPMHDHSDYFKAVKTSKSRKQNSIDIINSVFEETAVFPYEDCTGDDMANLHKYVPSERNVAFKKYHYTFPMVPKKVNTQMKVNTEEGFFIRFGYKRPVIEPLHFADYQEDKEDATTNNFYYYTNTRRLSQKVLDRFKTAVENFKPSLFYLDKSNDRSTLAKMNTNEYSLKSSAHSGNSAAMMMIRKVVSASTADSLQKQSSRNSSNEGSRRNSATSMDMDRQSFLESKDIKTTEEMKRKKELEKERQEKLKREMEKEMNMNSGRKLVSQKKDMLKKFKEERKLLDQNKRIQEEAPPRRSSVVEKSRQKVEELPPRRRSVFDEKETKGKSWKFW